MSVKNGVWHDAELDTPGVGDINKSLLVIRKIGSGGRMFYRYDFGIYNASVMHAPSCTWDGKWNKKNVVYWMPLPDMPYGLEDE